MLTDLLSWEWILFVNVPIGLATALLALRYVPESRGMNTHRTVDLPGAVTVTAGLIVLVYAIVKAEDFGWGSGRTLGLAAVAIALQEVGGALGLAVLSTLAADKSTSQLADPGHRPSPLESANALLDGFQVAFTPRRSSSRSARCC